MKSTQYEKVIAKVKSYCAYQERSHREVREKLYSFGLIKEKVESIIIQLIEEDFLNEQRFANLFVGGKFRQKQWGKQKIKFHLKEKGVSSQCILIAVKEIDQSEYEQTIKDLALEKWNSLEEDVIKKQIKTNAFLTQRGFENSLTVPIVKALAEGKSE